MADEDNDNLEDLEHLFQDQQERDSDDPAVEYNLNENDKDMLRRMKIAID